MACGRRAATSSPSRTTAGRAAGCAQSSDRTAGRRAHLPRCAHGARAADRGLQLPVRGRCRLRDYSVGNIIIAALADISGGFRERVEQAGRFLRIQGRGYPAANEPLSSSSTTTTGRSPAVSQPYARVDGRSGGSRSSTAGAAAPVRVIEAIEHAEPAVLAPSSLFTSTILAFLRAALPEALANFRVRSCTWQHHDSAARNGRVQALRPSVGDHRARRTSGDRCPRALRRASGAAALPLRAVRAAPAQIDREQIKPQGARVHDVALR